MPDVLNDDTFRVAKQKFLESAASDCHKVDDTVNLIRYVKAFDSMSNVRVFLMFLKRYDELMYIEETKDCIDENDLEELLSCCKKGNLFELGLRYITWWKKESSDKLGEFAQKFLEDAALSCDSQGDQLGLMKAVRMFDSFDHTQKFLKSLNRWDDLMLLEEERGNFIEAANIAKEKGEVLHEADLLGKAELFNEASILLLKYSLSNSLWSSGWGWPLKDFPRKSEALQKAKDFSKHVSDEFHSAVCSDSEILSNSNSISSLKQKIKGKMRSKIHSEFLLLRMLLDTHAREYKYNSDKNNSVSCGTLLRFWSHWHTYITKMLKENNNKETIEFLCSYFGLRKEDNDASLRLIDLKSSCFKILKVESTGNIINLNEFIKKATDYWCKEVLIVGEKVVAKLSEVCIRFPLILRSKCLVDIYETAEPLMQSEVNDYNIRLHECLDSAATKFFNCVFSLNRREALFIDIIILRKSDAFSKLINRILLSQRDHRNVLSFRSHGRIAASLLGSPPSKSISSAILKLRPAWRGLILHLLGGFANAETLDVMLANAVRDAYIVELEKEREYISPSCFIYLVERVLVLACYSRGCDFFVSKSSCAEWLLHEDDRFRSSVNPNRANDITDFVSTVVCELLLVNNTLTKWIHKTAPNEHETKDLVMRRLLMIAWTLFLNFSKCSDVLSEGYNVLPCALNIQPTNRALPLIAQACFEAGDPLVLVRQNWMFGKMWCPNLEFVDITRDQNPHKLLQLLYKGKLESTERLFEADGKSDNENGESLSFEDPQQCNEDESNAGSLNSDAIGMNLGESQVVEVVNNSVDEDSWPEEEAEGKVPAETGGEDRGKVEGKKDDNNGNDEELEENISWDQDSCPDEKEEVKSSEESGHSSTGEEEIVQISSKARNHGNVKGKKNKKAKPKKKQKKNRK